MILKFGFTVPNGIKIEDTVAWKSFKNLKKIEGVDVSYTVASGCCIGINRNLCINNAKNNEIKQTEFEFDYMLYVDYDIEFTTNDVIKLLLKNEPIISGAYRRKEDPRYLHAGRWKEGIKGLAAPGFTSDIKGVVEAEWIGGGFLLIAKEVFQKMEYPYFRYLVVEYEKDGKLCAEDTTEDFGFCVKANEAGFKILCDCDCLVKHHNHVKGMTDLDKPSVYMLKVTEQDLIFLNLVLQQATIKGSDVPLWVNLFNSIKNVQSSIS